MNNMIPIFLCFFKEHCSFFRCSIYNYNASHLYLFMFQNKPFPTIKVTKIPSFLFYAKFLSNKIFDISNK